MPTSVKPAPAEHAQLMDRIYRYTRHVYDATRKFYLLGRDKLIEEMDIQPGDHVVEIGCGTARNLIKLHRKAPEAALYGLDASDEMLKTAGENLQRAGLGNQVKLSQGLAEDLDPKSLFGLEQPFDVAFFSYALSMIPSWQEALDAALATLKPNGKLYIVDFGDHAELPGWFQKMQERWLALFHVQYRPELIAYLERLQEQGEVSLTLTPIAKRYALIATLTKRA